MTGTALQHRIDTCRQRFEAAPEGRAFAPLADALRQAGRHEEALALLDEGLARHPQFHAAMVILGHTLLDADRSEHARKVLERVLDHDSENVVALRLLAEDARSRREWGAAIPWLERLAVLEPDDERWVRALSEARANRNIPRGPRGAGGPDASFATLTLVEIYLAQGYRSRALAALRQMQQREPDRQDIRDRIAEISLSEEVLPGDEPAGTGGRNRPLEGREVRAAKRAAEKKSFEAWIDRIRTDESATP